MGARILLIEDNRTNLELMVFLLEAFGHSTLTAMDGKAGVEIARREVPDLIACDVHLPKLNGIEVARIIKQDPTLAHVPMIAVTAFAMVGDRDRILAAGFDGYISKPIEPETFVQQVDASLPESKRSKAGRPAPPLSPPAQSVAPVPMERAFNILVVDDLPVHLELARSILEPSGFFVTTAQNGVDALALAAMNPPDLILSDVNLASGSGFELVRQVKERDALKGIPFIFITSTAREEGIRTQGLAMGARAFLFRPIEPLQLLAQIRQYICSPEP